MRKLFPAWVHPLTLSLALSLALLVGGCSPQITAPDSRDVQVEQKEKQLDPDGWNKILEAVEASKKVTKFEINGKLETREQNRTHLATVYGYVNLPDRIDVSQKIDGRSYYLYQDADSSYFREEGVWRKIDRVKLPDTWGGLERLGKLQPPTVYRFGDISILTHNDTELYQFEADAVELAGLPASQAGTQAGNQAGQEGNQAGNQAGQAATQAGQLAAPQGKKIPSLYTIYIDKEHRYIRQIDIQSTSAVDDVGTVLSIASIRFASQNKDHVTIGKKPESLLQQLKAEQQ
ncbi:hypothetical protein [Effusibacillus lacus]|uniref:Lipoprotein n=1 Tax=Effusibacillus lacus TaxID=1348429 RepID=A0A292YEW8_9BACL|nr:hypothetical protein [Effusibacillus lacus]TCS73702.1 hypothetical protein EDD64_1162 [Effusibacillus lacus]GAX92082.1 hypothetical protein EFBL_3773 [Effusibacillus lacus]